MRLLLVLFMALSLGACQTPAEKYVASDAETFLLLQEDIQIGIVSNPENDQETMELKRLLVESWRFRIEKAGGFVENK